MLSLFKQKVELPPIDERFLALHEGLSELGFDHTQSSQALLIQFYKEEGGKAEEALLTRIQDKEAPKVNCKHPWIIDKLVAILMDGQLLLEQYYFKGLVNYAYQRSMNVEHIDKAITKVYKQRKQK